MKLTIAATLVAAASAFSVQKDFAKVRVFRWGQANARILEG
jgi:hypothetical protein